MTRRLGRAALGGLMSNVLLSALVAVGAGAVVLAADGVQPSTAFSAMVSGAFSGPGLLATLTTFVALAGCSLAFSASLRAGLFNLGGEGQLILGALATAIVGIYAPLPSWLLLPAGLGAGAVAGSAWAFLPAILEIRLSVPLLISTLLLSYPALAFVSWMVSFPLHDPSAQYDQTVPMRPDARLFELRPDLTAGIVIVLVLGLVMAVVDARTASGYEVRMMGVSPRFAAYGGVKRGVTMLRSMGASGALYGVTGAILVAGFPYLLNVQILIAPLYVWTALMAALLARGSPLGAMVASFAFAALAIGSQSMERATQIPHELADILEAVVIILVATRAAPTLLRVVRQRLFRRRGVTTSLVEPFPAPSKDAQAENPTEVGPLVLASLAAPRDEAPS